MTESAVDPLERVREALGHSFAREQLLVDALTHCSFVNEAQRGAELDDNERLEFLGDAVLGFAAATLLFERFPDASEGELTLRRSGLVSEAALVALARSIGIGPALKLGRGEDRTGGRDKPRLLASALEACFGAVLVDGGVQAALGVARTLLEPRVDSAAPGALDFKSRAQELVQARRAPPPRYQVLEAIGPDHAREFVVAMLVGEVVVAEGRGRTKLEAEQAAARAALPALADPALAAVAAPEEEES